MKKLMFNYKIIKSDDNLFAKCYKIARLW